MLLDTAFLVQTAPNLRTRDALAMPAGCLTPSGCNRNTPPLEQQRTLYLLSSFAEVFPAFVDA